MLEAYRTTRKDGAAGIDGITAADYVQTLEANLVDLLRGFRTVAIQGAGPCASTGWQPSHISRNRGAAATIHST